MTRELLFATSISLQHMSFLVPNFEKQSHSELDHLQTFENSIPDFPSHISASIINKQLMLRRDSCNYKDNTHFNTFFY